MIPTLFQLGPVAVHSYGLFVALAFLAAIGLASRRGRRVGIKPEHFVDLGLAALLGGLAAARVTFVALDPQVSWRELPYLWTGGLSFYGGLAGGIAACAVYARLRRLAFPAALDAAAPALALGYAIARVGCFLNGCCYGAPTALPWGCRFREVALGGLTPPSHPAQLYAAAGSLVVMGLLLAGERRVRVPGQLFLAYLGLYGVLRFLVEIFRRGYSATVMVGGLTQAQVASLVLILGAGLAAWALERRARHGRARTAAGACGGGGGKA